MSAVLFSGNRPRGTLIGNALRNIVFLGVLAFLAHLVLVPEAGAEPVIEISSSERAAEREGVFYSDQEITIDFKIDAASWRNAWAGVITSDDGDSTNAKLRSGGVAQLVIKKGEWRSLVTRSNERSAASFTARISEQLLTPGGEPRRDAEGRLIKRVTEKKFTIVRRRSPIRGTIRIVPGDILKGGSVAKVRVVLGAQAFANRVEPVSYHLALVQLATNVSGTLIPERVMKIPVREDGEASFAPGGKTEQPILAADWSTELKLDTAPGDYELRVRDAQGWIYDRKRLTVRFPKPSISGINVVPDPISSEFFGKKLFKLRGEIAGTSSAILHPGEKSLEAQSGDRDAGHWIGTADGLEAGSYKVRDEGGYLLGEVQVGSPLAPSTLDLIGSREAQATAGQFEAGKTIRVSVERLFETPKPWIFELTKKPAETGDGFSFDPGALDSLEPEPAPPTEEADGNTEAVAPATLGKWELKPGTDFLSIKLPDQPGEYDLVARQSPEAEGQGPTVVRFDLQVVPAINDGDFSVRLLQPAGGATRVLWPWASGFGVEAKVRDGAVTGFGAIGVELVRLKGTVPGGAQRDEESRWLENQVFRPEQKGYFWHIEGHHYAPGFYEARLFVSAGVHRTVARYPFQVAMPDLTGALRLIGEPEDDPTSLAFEIDSSRLNNAGVGRLSLSFVRRPARLPGGVSRNYATDSSREEGIHIFSGDGPKRVVLRKPFDLTFAEYEVWLEGVAGCFVTDCRRAVLARLGPQGLPGNAGSVPREVRSLLQPRPDLTRALNEPSRPFPADRQEPSAVPVNLADSGDDPSPESLLEGYPFLIEKPALAFVYGHHPSRPVAGKPVTLGFRLINLPDLATAELELHFTFLDAEGNQVTAAPVDDCCERVDDDQAIKCALGSIRAGAFREVAFRVNALPGSGLRWGVPVVRGGEPSEMWDGEVKAPTGLTLEKALVLEDQTGQVAAGSNVFAYRYPSPNGNDHRLRTIFVIGKELPQKPGDPFNLRSKDPTIGYSLLAYPDTDNVAHKDRYERGWARARRWWKLPPNAPLPEGYRALLIQARLGPGVLPGEKSLGIAGRFVDWDLRFGGLHGQIEFIRGAVEREYEILETVYSPERFKVRIRTSEGLPVAKLPILLHKIGRDGSKSTVKLSAGPDGLASLAPNGYPRVFVSNPVRLVDKGRSNLTPPPQGSDLPLEVQLAGAGPVALQAEIDPEFSKSSFEMTITPQLAQVRIVSSPGRTETALRPTPRDWTFKSALRKAAAIANQPVDDWETVSQQRATEIKRYVVTTFFVDRARKKEITIGHHAAMLLMRDAYLETLEDQSKTLERFLAGPVALKSYLEAMRPHALDRKFPINRIKVKAPDGTRVEYGYWALPYDDAFLMRRFGKTASEISRWRIEATREAITRMRAEMKQLADEARSIEDKDIKALLQLTGLGFETIKRRLIPRLMLLRQSSDPNEALPRLFWVPDNGAQGGRFWVNDLESVARTVQRIDREADQDNKLLLAGVTLASLPVTMSGYSGAMVFAMGMDLSALTAGAAMEFHEVYQSQAELDYSRRAAVVLGFERNEEALKNAKSWLEGATSVGIQAYGTYLNVLGMNEQAILAWCRSARHVAKGARVTQSLQLRGINSLSEIERRHAALFSLRAKMRELAEGRGVLSRVERAAIDSVESAASRSSVAGTQTLPPPGVSGFVTSPPRPAGAAGQTFDDLITLPPEVRRSAWRIEFDSQPGQQTISLARMESEMVLPATVSWTPARPGAPAAENLTASQIFQRGGVRKWKDIGNKLRGKVIRVGGEEFKLGDFFGGGSFTGAFQRRIRPGDQFPMTIKLTWRRIGNVQAETGAIADELGLGYLREIDSPNIRIARHFRTIEIADTSGHGQYLAKIVIEENLGRTAKQSLTKRVNQLLTPEEQQCYVRAMRDLNEAGYFWPENKWDNFGFLRENGMLKLTVLDPGGILKVKGATPAARAATARRLQSYVNGPFEDILAELEMTRGRSFGEKFRLGLRKGLIKENAEFIDDLDQLGDFQNMPFNPYASEKFDYLGEHFRFGQAVPGE